MAVPAWLDAEPIRPIGPMNGVNEHDFTGPCTVGTE